jgi:hypothetical protein
MVTTELPYAQQVPNEAEMEKIRRDMLEWAERNGVRGKLAAN